jgi:hypothetical protein
MTEVMYDDLQNRRKVELEKAVIINWTREDISALLAQCACPNLNVKSDDKENLSQDVIIKELNTYSLKPECRQDSYLGDALDLWY